jgi:hypothetical protein
LINNFTKSAVVCCRQFFSAWFFHFFFFQPSYDNTFFNVYQRVYNSTQLGLTV